MSERLRPFTIDDIDFAVAQTAREGWDSTREGFEVALENDPDGCFIAEAAGEAVGMITTTRYQHTAWVGNLIVVPAYRRRGLGERLMTHALEHIESHGIPAVHLEADPMGIGIYRRLGFADRFQSLRFRSDPPHTPVHEPRGESLANEDWHEVVTLDLGAFGDNRSRLLASLLQRSAASWAIRAEGRLQGFALACLSPGRVRLGPCVATEEETAEVLLDGFLHAFPEDVVVVGVPEVNPSARRILLTRQFREEQPCLRMVRGAAIETGRADELFAIANGAMG